MPFHTTKPGGTGIGLTLCRQIASAHRGTVQLINQADQQGCIAELVLRLTEEMQTTGGTDSSKAVP